MCTGYLFTCSPNSREKRNNSIFIIYYNLQMNNFRKLKQSYHSRGWWPHARRWSHPWMRWSPHARWWWHSLWWPHTRGWWTHSWWRGSIIWIEWWSPEVWWWGSPGWTPHPWGWRSSHTRRGTTHARAWRSSESATWTRGSSAKRWWSVM